MRRIVTKFSFVASAVLLLNKGGGEGERIELCNKVNNAEKVCDRTVNEVQG